MKRTIERTIDLAPVLLAAAFFVALVVSFGPVTASLTENADFASAPMIAEGIAGGKVGMITLGDYPWYEALWLLRATSVLPSHYDVWDLVPFVVWLVTAGLAGVATFVATRSRWAAAITTSLLLCAGSGLRQTLWSLDTHGPAAGHVALLGFALVVALRFPRWRGGLRGYGGAIVVGLITAVGATDPLLVPIGVAPLLLTAIALWLRRGDTAVLRLAIVVVLVALIGKHELVTLAEHARIGWTGRQVQFTDADHLATHIGWIPGAIVSLVTGEPFGLNVATSSTIAMVGGIVGLLTAIVAVWAGAGQALRALWQDRFQGRRLAAHPVGDADEWAGIVVFWLLVVAFSLTLWIFTNSPLGASSGRYLVSTWIGVCVLAPVLAMRLGMRWIASLAATAICFAATYAFISQPRANVGAGFPTKATAERLAAFGAAHGVSHGWAAYWDSASITVSTRFKLQLYPIYHCGIETQKGRNCHFYEHTITTWFAPRGGPTMLVIDTAQPDQPALDPVYGKPLASTTFGTYTAYILPADISQQLG